MLARLSFGCGLLHLRIREFWVLDEDGYMHNMQLS